jgi:hypothetical protein
VRLRDEQAEDHDHSSMRSSSSTTTSQRCAHSPQR